MTALWTPPDPALTDWRRILADYGQDFDGYGYVEMVLGRECPDVADEVWRRFEAQGDFTSSSFGELRCALFWLQRCVHSAEQSPGWRPDAALQARVLRLYAAILEVWRRERPDERGQPLSHPLLTLPTQDDLRKSADEFDHDWGGVDEVLYGICRAHPGHVDHREVTAKLALIDRAYSAGLERQVIPDPGAQAITKITDFVVGHASEVDAFVATLGQCHEPLSEAIMLEVAQVHGRFAELLRGIPTRGTTPRSFATKYLHFHAPIVPIYDSYAAARLVKLVPWQSDEAAPAPPIGADVEYWDFCRRFLRLYGACREAGLSISVKSLDTYLWAVPAK